MTTVANQRHVAFSETAASEPAQHKFDAQSLQGTATSTPTLQDLLEDGIYLLFLLRDKNTPVSCADFNQCIDQYLATFDRVCKTFGKSQQAITYSKYAFCALLDEIILSSGLPIRDDWERSPLQLRLFGEHLAGEGFFDRLEHLRLNTAENVELLEVFHTCLLLGFQGKYLLQGNEKLNYLIATLGQEIDMVRGPDPGFAPNWKIPFKFNEYVRHELPLWFYYALIAIVAVSIFFSLQWRLDAKVANLHPSSADPFPLEQMLQTQQPIQKSSVTISESTNPAATKSADNSKSGIGSNRHS
jgi:type VI secretion system protein ImpK